MQSYFFNFEVFEQEIQKKIESLKIDHIYLMDEFLTQLSETLNTYDIEMVGLLFSRLQQLPFDNLYVNYLTHPIRVSASYISMLQSVSYDDVALGLCHNIKEAGFLEMMDFDILSPETRSCIEKLTIDRSMEKDEIYLAEFYNQIADDSRDLMLLKALDKLDNTLWWVKFDVDPHDVDVVLDFVYPRIGIRYPKLASYIRDLTSYVLTDEAKSRYREEYEK